MSFDTCRLPYPGGSGDFLRLLIRPQFCFRPKRRTQQPLSRTNPVRSGGSRGCTVRFMLRPVSLFALLRPGLLLPSLRRQCHHRTASIMARWAIVNSHHGTFTRLDKQPYGLRPLFPGLLCGSFRISAVKTARPNYPTRPTRLRPIAYALFWLRLCCAASRRLRSCLYHPDRNQTQFKPAQSNVFSPPSALRPPSALPCSSLTFSVWDRYNHRGNESRKWLPARRLLSA